MSSLFGHCSILSDVCFPLATHISASTFHSSVKVQRLCVCTFKMLVHVLLIYLVNIYFFNLFYVKEICCNCFLFIMTNQIVIQSDIKYYNTERPLSTMFIMYSMDCVCSRPSVNKVIWFLKYNNIDVTREH